MDYYNVREDLLERIRKSGKPLRNAHLHMDRSYSLTKETLQLAEKDLKQKWYLIDEYKRNVSISEMLDKMRYCLDQQYNQGVRHINTFIDIDEVVGTKAIDAFDILKEDNRHLDVELTCSNQTLKGVVDKDARYWFDLASERVNYLGSLLAKDKGREEEHLDILFKRSKELHKPVIIHSDQFRQFEKETELVIKKVIEHGMQNSVTLVHCLSLNCFDYEYRHNIYRQLEDNCINIICCPSSWIDDKRDDNIMLPKSAPCTPVDEMLLYPGIKIGLGVDNISDIVIPYSDGDIINEALLLGRMIRTTNLDLLVKLLTTKIV